VWRHAAVTIDCTVSTNLVATLYTNGYPWLVSNIVLQAANAVPNLTLTDAPGSTYGQGLTIGAWGHNGTPPLTDSDELPNNGWFYGGIDQLKVFDRILSAAEIAAEFAAGDAAATGGASGSGGSSAGRVARATTARVGSMRRP
jgi:hypothetical protein